MVTRPFWAAKWELSSWRMAAARRRTRPAYGVVVDLRHRREQLGVEDDADLAADVVEHAVGVHRAIALAEDDVAFHVDFERHFAGLSHAGRAAADIDAPDHDAVGFDIDIAERAKRGGQAVDRETLNDDVHAAADDGDLFAGWRGERFAGGAHAFGARENLHAAEAGAAARRLATARGRFAAA